MSKDNCKSTKILHGARKATEENVNKAVEEEIEKLTPLDTLEEQHTDEIESELIKNGQNPNEPVEYDTLRKAYKKLYGNIDERELLSIQIKSLLKENPVARFILQNFLKNKKVLAMKDDKKGIIGKNEAKVLRNYGVGTLRNLLFKLTKFQESDQLGPFGKKQGLFLKIKSQFRKEYLTPGKLGENEASGAIYIFHEQGMKNYYALVQNAVNKFGKGRTETIVDEKGKVKNIKYEGMGEIFADLNGLLDYGFVKQGDVIAKGKVDNDTLLTEIFVMYMKGAARIEKDEKGNLIIQVAEQHSPIKIDGNVQTHPDGSVKYSYSNFTDIKTAHNGMFNLPLEQVAIKKLEALRERARKVDNAAFNYIRKNFDNSVKQLLGRLSNIFPGLSEQEFRQLLYFPETMKKHKEVFNRLSPNQKLIFSKIKESLGSLSSLDYFQFGVADTKYMKFHWPTIYNKDKFRGMWDDFIQTTESNLGLSLSEDGTQWIKSGGKSLQLKLDDVWDSEKNQFIVTSKSAAEFTHPYKGTVYKGLRAVKILKKQINDVKSSLTRAYQIRDSQDGYSYDNDTQQPIIPLSDQKYFKRLSNAFNPLEADQTKASYTTYLKGAMQAIQRNLLAAKYIEAVTLLYEKSPDGVVDDKVVEHLNNMFTVPFNNPKTYMSFMGMKFSSESLSNSVLNKHTFNIKEENIQNAISTITSFLTFKHIGGFKGAITNLGGAVKHLQKAGVEKFSDGMRIWNREIRKGTENTGYKELIANSGVIDFNDFFSDSMVSSLVKDNIENENAQLILGEMLSHYNRTRNLRVVKKNFIKKDKMKDKKFEDSYNLMQANIEQHLYDSRSLRKKDEGTVILDEKRAKSRLSQLRKRRNKARAANLANASINAQYQITTYMNLNSKDNPFKNVFNVSKWGAQKTYSKWIQFKSMGGTFTMGSTEEMIRSVAFIMGVEHAKEQGHLPLKPFSDYTQQETDKAITYGDHFSKIFNYGLSTSDVGLANYGAVGNLFGKFKYWSQQNMGDEINIIQEAFRSVRDTDDIIKGKSKRLVELFRILKLTTTTGGKKLRMSNQEVATFRSFILIGGIATVISDLLIFGPIPALRLLKYAGGGGSTIGARQFSSDLLSMAIFLTVRLPYLLLSGDTDEEEMADEFSFIARKGPFGWLPNTGIDIAIMIIAALSEAGTVAEKKARGLLRNAPGAQESYDFMMRIFRD